MAKIFSAYIGTVMAALFGSMAMAQTAPFGPGDVIPDYGPVAKVETDITVTPDTELKLLFDLYSSPEEAELNPGLTRVARLVNLHGEGGVEPARLKVALVLHGPAIWDVTSEGKDGTGNPNAALVQALGENGVRFVVCGQAAAKMGVEKADLLPGVDVALSAMTAHALFQGDGYALIP